MKKYILINIAFLFALSTNSQNVKTYNGPMTEPEWIAELFGGGAYGFNGSYSYYEDKEGNRILHGSFKISYTYLYFGDFFGDFTEIRGNYNHGKRNGHWTIKKKDQKTGKENPNYYYDFNYKDGMLNGKISFRDGKYEMTGKFVNGTISDTVLCRYNSLSHNLIIKGKVNKEGVPHGVWIEKGKYNTVPKEATRLYYNGCMVYRKEKDLSSGKIEYTYQISNSISIPSDLDKIQDTTIDGVKYVDVGGIICGIDTNSGRSGRSNDFLLFNDIYPAIQNWNMEFDTNTYKYVLREKQREIERRQREIEYEKQREIEKQRKIERQKKREEEQLEREIEQAYEGVAKNIAKHCWANEAFKEFKRLYKEGGVIKVYEEFEKVIRFEYENYTIGELAEKTKNEAVRNSINQNCGSRIKKKRLTWLFSTYQYYFAYVSTGNVSEAFIKENIRKHRLKQFILQTTY